MGDGVPCYGALEIVGLLLLLLLLERNAAWIMNVFRWTTYDVSVSYSHSRVIECCCALCRRVLITESTLDHLHGEFDTEPAHGDQRNTSLRSQQISTYFIVFQHPRKVWKCPLCRIVVVLRKDGYRQRERASVSAINLRHIIWLPHESHASMSLSSAVRRVQTFGYVKRV